MVVGFGNHREVMFADYCIGPGRYVALFSPPFVFVLEGAL